LDANDHAPTLNKPKFDFFINENAPLNSVVYIFTAMDQDHGLNGVVNFELTENSLQG